MLSFDTGCRDENSLEGHKIRFVRICNYYYRRVTPIEEDAKPS